MDDHQIKALQKVLSCAEEAYEKFRPAIGQRLVGIEGSTGDRVCPDLYSRIFGVEGELLSLIVSLHCLLDLLLLEKRGKGVIQEV